MIKIMEVSSFTEVEKVMQRSEDVVFEVMDYVKEIVQKVRNEGDAALLEFTEKFDGIKLTKETLRVTPEEIKEAYEAVSDDYIATIKRTIERIETYHKKQYPESFDVPVGEGVLLGRRWSPIERVGVYVPGGKAAYLTAGYMLGVPARIAGCKEIVMCSPPDRETGKLNPYLLVSADLSGITEMYKAGGAQAIAAFAYGTETLKPVYKIFGPGNIYVTAAKISVFGKVNIDMPAGPSEALIVSDGSVEPEVIASDVMSQAEHDPESAAILLTDSKTHAEEVKKEIELATAKMPRSETIKTSLGKFGAIIVCDSMDLCIEIANRYAPEHCQVMTADSDAVANRIINAGSLCVGKYSSVALGDYISGTNNVIPTGGATKMFSPIHVESYMKCYEVQKVTEAGLKALAADVDVLAGIEGFHAHNHSVQIRAKSE